MFRSTSLRLALIFTVVLLLLACGTESGGEYADTEAPQEVYIAPTSTPEPEATPTVEEAWVSVTKNTNCRSGPSTGYPIEVTIPQGTDVIVLGRTSGSDYYYVQNPNDPASGCWIWGELATIPINIEILPIFTPMPLPTLAFIPTAAIPDCDQNAWIVIQNDTGGQLTLYLKGPYNYTFYVSPGTQTLSICSGSYTYTAYGCGGASRSGSVSDGDEIEFWCQ